MISNRLALSGKEIKQLNFKIWIYSSCIEPEFMKTNITHYLLAINDLISLVFNHNQ